MENYKLFIDELLHELSYRTSTGIVNLKDRNQISLLSEILIEWGLTDIKDELIGNLLGEADDKKYKNPALNKIIKYKNTKGEDAKGKVGSLLRRPKDEDAYKKAVAALGGEDTDTYKKAMVDLGGEGQPGRDIEKEKEKKDGEEQSQEEPQKGTAFKGKALKKFTDQLSPLDSEYTGGGIDNSISSKILSSFSNEKDDILNGVVSPPGTGGSAIGEMYGGTAIQDVDLTEDEFIEKHFEDVRNSEISKGMKDKDIISWLKVAYKTGQNEIKELSTNPKYRYKQPQSQPYPVPVMDPVNKAGNARKKLIDLFENKLKEAEENGDKKAITHYKRQLHFINNREDTDTGVLYETTDGFIGFKHTSNKKGYDDPVFNTTVNQRGEVMKSSVEGVSNEYNFNEAESNKINGNIDNIIQTAVISIQDAGKGPSGALQSNVSDSRKFSSDHKLGKQFKNLGGGSKGRSNYLENEIKAEMATNTKTGKKVNGILQEWGLQEPYSDDDIAAAVLELSKRGDTTKRVTTMVVKLSDNVKLAREVYNRLRKQNPDLSDDEIKEKTLETINGYKTNDGVPFDRESLDSLLSPDLDWLEKVGSQTRDAMSAAHEQIVTDLTNADEEWQRQNSPNEPQPPVNGPHTQSYIQSYMKQMHWDRYILGDEEDIGDMNIEGNTVNSTMIRGCLAELSGYSGDLNSKEGRDGLMNHLRKTMRISSESQSLTFNNVKSGKTIEIGKESYRTKGVGNNSLLGNFGKDLQSCLKSK